MRCGVRINAIPHFIEKVRCGRAAPYGWGFMKNIRQIQLNTGPLNDITDVKYLLSHTLDQTSFDLTVTTKHKMTEQEFVDWLEDFVDYYNDNEGDIFNSDNKIITEVQ